MEMQSADIGEMAQAFAKAQGDFTAPKKTKTNPHLKNKYADLGEIIDAVRPALSANGISLSQPALQIDGKEFVVTQLTHSSGQWMRSCVPVFDGNLKGAQGYGSGATYARRYGLSGLTGVAADDDDDGNGASGQGSRQARAEPKPDDKPHVDPKATVKRLMAKIDAIKDAATCNVETIENAYSGDWKSISQAQRDWLSERIANRAGTLMQAPADDPADLTDVPF